MLADALLRCGRAEEALDHLTEALETVQETPGYFYEPELHRLRAAALVALRPGQGVEEARGALRRGLELADAHGSPPRLRLLLALHDLDGRDGGDEAVRPAIEAALTRFPEEDQAPDLLRARAVLERGMPVS